MRLSAHLLERIEYVLDMPRDLAWADTGMRVTSDNALRIKALDVINYSAPGAPEPHYAFPEGTYNFPDSPLVDFYAPPLTLRDYSATGHDTGWLAQGGLYDRPLALV